MKDAYPELVESAIRVAEMIKGEETRFAHTLDIGLKQLEALLHLTRMEHERQASLPDFAVTTKYGGAAEFERATGLSAADVTRDVYGNPPALFRYRSLHTL